MQSLATSAGRQRTAWRRDPVRDCLFCLATCLVLLALAVVPAAAESPYQQGPRSFDGIGRYYLGREISQVMGHRGAAWLERVERQQEERTDLLVANLPVNEDSVVIDVGAGTGYFSFRIAERLEAGRVIAVDIQPEMLTKLRRRLDAAEVNNVVPHLGTVRSVALDENVADVALLVDAYHEFAFPLEMANSIFKALRPGGLLVLVEYRGEDPSVPILPHHKMTEWQVRKEMDAAGFEWVRTEDYLPRQHVLTFQKPLQLDAEL